VLDHPPIVAERVSEPQRRNSVSAEIDP